PTYAKLSKKLDGELIYLIDDVLYFSYFEEYNPNTLKFTVYSRNYCPQYTEVDIPLTSFYGDNRFSIDFGSDCLYTKINILEVVNDKGEKWYLRFKQTGSTCIPPMGWGCN